MISSHFMTLLIVLGSYLYVQKEIDYLPVSIEGCTNTTFSPHIVPPFDEMIRNKTIQDIIVSNMQSKHASTTSTEYVFTYRL